MEDRDIVTLYWQRDQEAIRQTDRQYGRYLSSIAFHILADREDSRETVNDTYLRAWDSMPPHRPQVLATYLGRITYPDDTWRQGISPEHTVPRQLLLQLNDEMSAIPCRFSPALINAVNGIVSVNLIVEGIDADVSLTFITVGIHHQITFSCFSVGETKDSGTRTARHFSKDLLIR